MPPLFPHTYLIASFILYPKPTTPIQPQAQLVYTTVIVIEIKNYLIVCIPFNTSGRMK